MDILPKNKYLQMNTNTLEEVRRDVNLHRPGEMKEAVRILQEWIQQQAHFKKKDFPPFYLETTILSSKGSIDRAKRIIDMKCTIRTLMPEFFVPFNPKTDFTHIWDKNYFNVLPKMTPDNCRIVLFKIVGKYKKAKSIEPIYKNTYLAMDYLQLHDYHKKIIIIYDLLEMDALDTFTNINLMDLKNFYSVMLDSYGVRVKRIHLITRSKLIEKFIGFFRPFLKKKIMDRIEVHQSSEELHLHYPKNILPKDFGGDEKYISELHDECINTMSSEEHLKHMESMMVAQVDEMQRPQALFNELYAGTVGTFRTLTVD